MKTKAKNKLICIIVATVILGGCSTPKLSDSLYRESEVGIAKQTVRCRVLAVREIKIRGDKEDNLGGLAGGILGGTLGSDVGGGLGSLLAIEAGAILGGIAGNKAGDRLSQRNGLEYSVITSQGNELTFTQEHMAGDRIVKPGETCRMQMSADGRNRVLPVSGFASEIKAPETTKIIQ